MVQANPGVHGWDQFARKTEYRRRGTQGAVLPVTSSDSRFDYCSDMPHTYSSMLVHCVFSTKQRMNLIRQPQLLARYLAGIAKAKKIPLVIAGGIANHVHLLLDLPPHLPLAQAMQQLKGNSSRWMNEEQPPFAWQQGYGAFGIGRNQRQIAVDYIAGQAEHHKRWTFEQEFLTLLGKYAIEYDKRYVFG